jgi:hypothetical protein
MSATAAVKERPKCNPPIMGERARAACALSVEGGKRRRLLVLLGAVADANDGVCCPPPALLIERIAGIEDKGKLFAILKRLGDDGLIRARQGGGYELLFLNDDERDGG